MSTPITLLLGAVVAFIALNSVLTVVVGTISWLIEKFGWKAWTLLGVLACIIGYVLYLNFGDVFGKILLLIQ